MEKDRKGYRSYQLHLETAKKVHEPLKEGAKDYDVCVCWNDWGVLRVDDFNMILCSITNENQKISFMRSMGELIL